jgi:hypothetical protein
MQPLRQPQNNIVDIEPAAENDGIGVFEQAGAAE